MHKKQQNKIKINEFPNTSWLIPGAALQMNYGGLAMGLSRSCEFHREIYLIFPTYFHILFPFLFELDCKLKKESKQAQRWNEVSFLCPPTGLIN